MHQPASTPRQSIYYRYQVFDSPPPPATPGLVPALVVGAGPIGLVTALGLAQQGVRCVLIEAERQVSEGSRAIVFTRRSMEILQQVGVADAVLAMGLPWRCGNSFYRGQRVFRMEAPQSDDDRFAPMTNLQQQYLEEMLLAQVARQPLIELRWGHKVIGLPHNQGDHAVLDIDTPHGPYQQAASWVVAADGARSALRQLCDVKLEGNAYEGRFVIADIRIDLPLPTERLAFFDPVWNPGNTVLMHREPHGIWRIDYQLPPDETPEQALAPASLAARINAQLAMIGLANTPWELDWSSVYSARALTLPNYVHERVAFVGDAAHLLPIFGVRGANTGFQDAQNLAWKLGQVLRGNAPPALLGSYSHERVAAAREIIDEAGKSTRFMTPPSHGFRLLRDAVLSLSLSQAFVRPLYHWRTSRPHDYLQSPLNAADDDNGSLPDGPANGCPVPNLQLARGHHLLDALCGEGAGPFTLLLAQGQPDAALLAAVQACQSEGLPLRLVAATAQPPAPRPPGLAAWLHDADGRLPAHLGLPPTGAVLIRPDQHLCARWQAPPSASQLTRALHRALART